MTEAGFRLSPDTVRAPDVAFVRAERAAVVGPGSAVLNARLIWRSK